MDNEVIFDSNVETIDTFVKLVFRTTDVLISKEVDGVLKTPSDIEELKLFNANVKTLIENKLRQKFGV
jgi:hypothetical protein